MITIFIRTVIIYVFLILAMRLGGKRQIGELQISELVTALLLSEIAAIPIGHDEIPLTFAVIPILTVVTLEIISAFTITKSRKLQKFFDGNPSIAINKGVLDTGELSKLRLGIEDLISEARQKGISDIADLEYAILEDNGKLSVFEKAKKGEKETGIAHTIIVDGEINSFGMSCIGMTDKVLGDRLNFKGVNQKDVFLYTVDDSGKENWIMKSIGHMPAKIRKSKNKFS